MHLQNNATQEWVRRIRIAGAQMPDVIEQEETGEEVYACDEAGEMANCLAVGGQ